VTEENSRRGKSNRARGGRWMDKCARALRELRWPGAEVVSSNGRSDLTGCGDIGVECKDTQDWSHIAEALEQAYRDAIRRGLPTCCVWKKRSGKDDPMAGYIVMDAALFWADRARFEELERTEAAHRALVGQLAEAQARKGTFTLTDPRDEIAKLRAAGVVPAAPGTARELA
jgi:hypothetical protein